MFDALKMRYNGLNVADLQVIFDTVNNVSFLFIQFMNAMFWALFPFKYKAQLWMKMIEKD